MIDLDMPDGYDIRHIENHTVDDQEIIGFVIQGGIQRAIQAHGWVFVIVCYPPDSFDPCGHCRVVIEMIVDGWNGTEKIAESEADTPAEAILAAYMAVCEAMG
jgi:hypothetical protein